MASTNTDPRESIEDKPIRTLNVAGLSCITTDDDLNYHFRKFGIVETACVEKAPSSITNVSGTVTFAKPSMIETALLAYPHILNAHLLELERAAIKLDDKRQNSIPTRTIFVGGLHVDTTEEDLYIYFGTHGDIVSVNIVIDVLGFSKRYGFVVFTEFVPVERIVPETHRIRKKIIQVKKFYPKEKIGGLGGGKPHTSGKVNEATRAKFDKVIGSNRRRWDHITSHDLPSSINNWNHFGYGDDNGQRNDFSNGPRNMPVGYVNNQNPGIIFHIINNNANNEGWSNFGGHGPVFGFGSQDQQWRQPWN